MYEWMLDNAQEYPIESVDWDGSCKRFNSGDWVKRDGRLYKSLEDMNTNDPLDYQDGTWEKFKKFGDNQCANDFWEYAIQVLAVKVFSRSLGFTTLKAGTGGLTVLESGSSFSGQGVRSGNHKEIADYRNDLAKDEELALGNMIRWAKKKLKSSDICDFPLSSVPNCSGVECQPNTRSKRRWGFAK